MVQREIRPEFTPDQEMGSAKVITMDRVLSLFGTEEAKRKFLDLCRRYCDIVVQAKANRLNPDYSEPARARIHNEIMGILQRLSMSHPQALFLGVDRDDVANMILEYYGIAPIRKEGASEIGRMMRDPEFFQPE